MPIKTAGLPKGLVASGDVTVPETFAAVLAAEDRAEGGVLRTDVLFQDFRVYIEGIEVPFAELHVSEPYMALPVASVTLPYFPGLTEIGRNYFPKVHIFYRDIEAEKYFRSKNQEYDDGDIYRLKFSGVIHRYSYSRQQMMSTAAKQFVLHCSHKYYVLNELVTQFGARSIEGIKNSNLDNAVVKVSSYYGTQQMALDCMRPTKVPLTTTSPGGPSAQWVDLMATRPELKPEDVDITILPPHMLGYQDRVQGIPGYLANIWSALKRDTYSSRTTDGTLISRPMIDLYIPLVDNGLKFFQRMSGHHIIEEALHLGVDTEGVRDDIKVENGEKVILPPIMHASMGRAISIELSLSVMQKYLEYTGQTGSLLQIFQDTLNHMRYDMSVLASPVQKPGDTIEGVDVLVKPVMVTYFSPTCNVILPTMYDSISVDESYYDVPTRVSAVDDPPVIENVELPHLQYRAPHLYRQAVAALKNGVYDHKQLKGNLQDTLSYVYEAVGSHELGQGIRYKFSELEPWVRFLFSQGAQTEEDRQKATTSDYEEGVEDRLATSWLENHNRGEIGVFSPELLKLCPWVETKVNGFSGPQRNLLSTLEYDYSLSLVQARMGRVSGVFNPHIIPGYPCDILSKNASDPSYHAFVTSVDTTFSSSGFAGTSISFSSAFTYDEFGTYYLPAAQPWLSVQLNVDKNPSMIKPDPAAIESASKYYKSVLGVGAAFPSALYDFEQGRGQIPVLDPKGDIKEGVEWPYNVTGEYLTMGETSNKILSTEAALAMTRREIENLSDVEISMGVKFIHLPRSADGLYILQDTQNSAVASVMKVRAEHGKKPYHSLVKATGKSIFLDYPDELPK